MNKQILSLCLAAGLVAVPATAIASDDAPDGAYEDRELIFHIGGGGRIKPRYEGASTYLLYPFPIFRLQYLRIPGITEIDSNKRARGFFFYPSFDFIGRRSPKDDKALLGLKEVDWAVEVGAGAGYRVGMFSGYLELRRGFNGYSGWVGEAGLDITYQPDNQWRFSGGPRLTFGDGNYMRTYFGVTPAESVLSGYPVYRPGSGIKTYGLAALATYQWTEDIGVHVEARWDRLTGDADNSPIVRAGDENQFSVGIGLTHRFSVDLFD